MAINEVLGFHFFLFSISKNGSVYISHKIILYKPVAQSINHITNRNIKPPQW